jgi:hypothetical protein
VTTSKNLSRFFVSIFLFFKKSLSLLLNSFKKYLIFMKKLIFASAFSLFAIFTACHHSTDNSVYVVNIEFTKPDTDNATFTINQSNDIVIKLKRDDNSTIHNVSVDVTSPDKKTSNIYKAHESKTGTVTVNQTYKPTLSGTYTITCTTTDAVEAQPNVGKRTFTVK